jgi:hypothetical protein
MSLFVRSRTASTGDIHRLSFARDAAPLLVALVLLGLNGGCPKVQPRSSFNLIVRGYITTAVGRSFENRTAAIPALRGSQAKDVYLPGVEVYLQEAVSGKTSKAVRTDLSGRFTLYAPRVGRYHLCWKSTVYGVGCDPAFISVGGEPQFVSAVRIPLQPRAGFVSMLGHVTTADGAIPRTFDPMLNINSFATVSLEDENGKQLAQVYVNNYGDYLMPYVPAKQKLNLTAAIESAKFTQEIRPEAQIEAAPFSQMNLRFENHRPQLDPLVAFDAANKRIQNAAAGSQVFVQANARDLDGDPLNYAWFVGEGQGKVLQSNGPKMKWELPNTPGRYTAEVVAYDNKGGYDRAVVSVLAGAVGVPFTGFVVTPTGAPVVNASIDIVGNPVLNTDTNGRFQANVKEANRYVLNIRKEGFALNSRVYDRAITGGRWILRPAQVVTIDPTRDVNLTHRRGERDCPGPDSVHAGLGVAGNSLTIPQWQDGKGNVMDPPSGWDGPRSMAQLNVSYNRSSQREHPPAFLPRELKLPGCGPGISVEIPANSILDPSGNPAIAPIKVAISTIDLFSPQQMPGDDSVVPLGGGGAFLQSFGAGSLDLPSGFKLKSGALAKITIPVDRARLMGGSRPPTVPLLFYDEQKGLWLEEDILTLSTINGVQAYVGKVKHFTTYNADTTFTNAACLRVFSPTLPSQYNLEVMSPYADGTPHYKNYPIDNTSPYEHVIYNITPNANMTLAPMTQGANPQLLGFYIVNSGPPETPSNSPNPPPLTPQGYTSCNNFVVLKIGSAPDSPFGGEFLHGLGFIDAANLGGLAGVVDDLTYAAPTGNVLRDALVTASRNYYATLDPGNAVISFEKFKNIYGFSQNPATPAATEIVASYANSGDLGFGRDMHCLKKANGDVACYVTNYGTGYANITPGGGAGGGTDDQDDANAAGQRVTVGASAEVATVAMEYSDLPGAPGSKVVKFYVYKKALTTAAAVTPTNPAGAYARSISANLDGRGERPVPQLCMICHGGQVPQQSGGVPAFGNNTQVTLGSRFLPFDHRLFTFPTNPANLTKALQEPSIKNLNEQIVNAAPPAPATDPIREVVSGMYNNGASPTQTLNFAVPNWVNGASANAPNQETFYQRVVANACRTCHIAQPYSQLQFNTSGKFLNLAGVNLPPLGADNHLMLGTAQMRVCGDYVMPHALRTHDIFWGTYSQYIDPAIAGLSMPIELQNFGDGVGGPTWKANLCTSFISNLVSSPSQFYQHTIQPIWNGKCVACHIVGNNVGAPFFLTEANSYNALVNGIAANGTPRVVRGNDSNNAGTLLQRITGVGPGSKMPLGCIAPPTPPGPGQLPCLEQSDIDKIKAWIRNGAN